MSKQFRFFIFAKDGKKVETPDDFPARRPKGRAVSASNKRRAAEKRIQRETEAKFPTRTRTGTR